MKKMRNAGIILVMVLGLSLFNVPASITAATPEKYESLEEAWLAMQDLLLPEIEEVVYDEAFAYHTFMNFYYMTMLALEPMLYSSVDGNLAEAYSWAMYTPYYVNATKGSEALYDVYIDTYAENETDWMEGVTSENWNESAASIVVYGDAIAYGLLDYPVEFIDEYLVSNATIDGDNVTTTNASMLTTYYDATYAQLTEAYEYVVGILDEVTTNATADLGMVPSAENALELYVLHMQTGNLTGYGNYDPSMLGGLFASGLVSLPIFDHEFVGNIAEVLNPTNGSSIANATGLALWLDGSNNATLNATFGLAAGEFEIIYNYIVDYEASMAAEICGFFGIDTVPVAEIPSALMLHQWLYGDVNWFLLTFDFEFKPTTVGFLFSNNPQSPIAISTGYELGTNRTGDAPYTEVILGDVSNITMEQAAMLWSLYDPYSLVTASAASMWTKAAANSSSAEYDTLKTHFGLNDSSMAFLLDWTTYFRTEWCDENIANTYGSTIVAEVEYTFYAQWVSQYCWTENTTTYGVAIPEGFNLNTSSINPENITAIASKLFFNIQF